MFLIVSENEKRIATNQRYFFKKLSMQENSSLSKQVFFSFWCWKWERTVKEKHPASTLPDWRFTILSQPGLAGSWGKDTVRWEHFGDVLNISRCAYGAQLVLETYCKEMITRLFLRQLEKVLIFRHTFLSLKGGGVPLDLQDTAWESAHFSWLTGPRGGPKF